MTGAQVLINQGKAEGRLEGQTAILLDLLEARFGPLAQETIDNVKSLPENRIAPLARRVLTANSLAELEI